MKKRTTKLLFPGLIVALVLFISACTTKKNTVATRSYHNLTSRFNGYFYAKESLKEGVDKLYKTHVDRFDRILPVFNYADLKESQTLTAEMDKAYKKASSVIERHSIYLKGEEHCNWIDDSYLVIGKSHFYRHNYIDALEVFDFMQIRYKKFPSRYEAMLWSFRCQNEVGTSAIAEGIMDEIRYDKKFPERLKGEYYAICADFYNKRDDYSLAIENLNLAIPLTKSKRDRTRYTFVLAQLYQKQGQLKKASQLFGKVVKMNPVYEMAFSAKINEARCFDVTSGNTADLKKRLKKMLKDDKNNDYQDQIYYALAEIADKEKQRELAVDYLHNSIETSTTNTYQKGLSSLKLGDLYLQIPDFIGAQAYYDTAVSFLNPEFPDYEAIVTKSKSLTALVTDLKTIAREDSLQGIAKLDDAGRTKLLEQLEQKAKEEAQLKKEKEEEAKELEQRNQNQPMSPMSGGPGAMGFPGGTGERGWYFYNQQTLSFGFSEFQKKWGNRKLEDNWRRSNKQQQSPTDDFGNPNLAQDSIAGDDDDQAKGKNGLVYRNKASFLKDIPLTDAAIKKSNDTIINAYYDLASVYKDQLFFNDKAIQTYEELLKRFPDNRYKLSCYFQLYNCYTQAEDEVNANKYKNILLNDYPNSDYALIIKDPNYGKNKAFSKSEATKYYELTYQLFLDGNYNQVLMNCASSDTLFPNSKYKPKYDFLKALCIGKTASLDDYIKSLRLVVAKYPKDEVKARASDMLEVLLKLQASQQKANTPTAVIDTTKKSIPALYNFNPEAEHFCIVILPSAGLNLSQQKANLSDFNDENFGGNQLIISDLVFSTEQQLITVKSFPNKEKAMLYLAAVKKSDTLFKDIPNQEKVKILVVSSDNYPILYNKKDVAAYEMFFGQKYPQ